MAQGINCGRVDHVARGQYEYFSNFSCFREMLCYLQGMKLHCVSGSLMVIKREILHMQS